MPRSWLMVVGLIALLLPLVIFGMSLGIGWTEAFGERWALGLLLVLLALGALWGYRQAQRYLPVASPPPVRQSVDFLQVLWSAQLMAVGVYGVIAYWWINRAAAAATERWVLLPWVSSALVCVGLGLLLAGWWYGGRALVLERVRHADVTVQRRRIQSAVFIVWSCFETTGVLGMLLACGTVSLLPYDLLGGGAIASLVAHRVLWFERVVDLITHPPLVETPPASSAALG